MLRQEQREFNVSSLELDVAQGSMDEEIEKGNARRDELYAKF